tara:strand:+ start:96 stop:968 length:873 start_codon:yes stop_codon:yes gene_type:complete
MKLICYNWMPTIADHVLDMPEQMYTQAGTSRQHNINSFNPYAVKDGDLIFVKTDFIVNGTFEKTYLDKIFSRFSLITGVSSYHLGRDGGDQYKKILNHPNLIKWACTNPPAETNNKIIPLPIGFQEPDRPGGNQEMLLDIFKNRTDFKDKENKIFLPYHTPTTNHTRQQSFDYLKKLPFVVSQEDKQSIDEYYKSLDRYKFVIGLEGSGPDIHRNYETFLVGSIPINIKNIIKQVFEFQNATGIFLENWSELDDQKFRQILKNNYDISANDKFLDRENHIKNIKLLTRLQ